MKSTGETVAVKVQHKWIKEQCSGDLKLIRFASDCAIKLFPDYKYGWLPDEFQTRLPNELDFQKEATNAEKCLDIFKNNPNVAVPKVYRELTRERVLVMSFEPGVSVSKINEMKEMGIYLRNVAKLITEAGFVHGDPHPGNLFVRKKQDGRLELVLLDHGIYTDLSEECRLAYTKLWRGILA